MYSHLNQNITIGYDESTLSKIKEMIEDGWKKLKSFVKSKSHDKKIITKYNAANFDFYNDLKDKFKIISAKLKEQKLCEEHKYFLSISHFINYIVYKNSLNPTFGHCCFALDLMKFFLELFKTNIEFYKNPTNEKNFQKIQNEFKRVHFEYKREFYWNIYQSDDEFDEEKMYNIAKNLRK